MFSIRAIVVRDFLALVYFLDGTNPNLAVPSEILAVRRATVIDELGVATGFSIHAPILVELEHVEGALLKLVASDALGSSDLFARILNECLVLRDVRSGKDAFAVDL